jgi:hypothetical protein
MQSSPDKIRELCEQVLAANLAKNEDAVLALLAELQLSIRSHVLQTRIMAIRVLRRAKVDASLDEDAQDAPAA